MWRAKCLLTSVGLQVTQWNHEARGEVTELVDDVLPYLSEACSIEHGLTLAELCRFVQDHPRLTDVLQGSAYAHCSLGLIHEQLQETLVVVQEESLYGPTAPLLKASYTFSLWEIIAAIYDNLSYEPIDKDDLQDAIIQDDWWITDTVARNASDR